MRWRKLKNLYRLNAKSLFSYPDNRGVLTYKSLVQSSTVYLQKSDLSPAVSIVLIASTWLQSVRITNPIFYLAVPQHFFCLITLVLSSRASLLTPPSIYLQCVFVTSIRKRNRNSVGRLDVWASPVKRLPLQWPVMVCIWWSVVWLSFRRCSVLFSSTFFLCLARRMSPRAENQITPRETTRANVTC